jgi:hypothetical protein
MPTTWGVRATTTASGINAEFVARAARHAGGHGSIAGGIIVADGFLAQRNVDQFCARVHLRFPNLKFEISRPATAKKKKC